MSTKNDNKSWQILPYILLAIVPTIVFLKVVELDEVTKLFWISDKNMDFFSYYKSALLMLVGLLGVVSIFIGNRKNTHNLKPEKYSVLMGIYMLMVLISYFFSEYKGIAAIGFSDRYEGTIMLLTYGVIFYMGATWKDLHKHIKTILNLFIIASLYIGIIGIGQYFGADYFRSSFGKGMILPSSLQTMKDTLSFTFGAKTIYTTLYNTNYVGSFMVMMFMVAVGMYFSTENKKHRIYYALSSAVFFFNIIGSNSRAGYIGTIGAIALFIVFNIKRLKNYKKQLGIVAIAIVGTLALMQVLSGGMVGDRFAAITDTGSAATYILDDISIEGDSLSIKSGDITLVAKANGANVNFFDASGTELSILPKPDNQSVYLFLDERYVDFEVPVFSADNIVGFTYKGNTFYTSVVDGVFKYMDNKGIVRDTIEAETFGFEGKEMMGSSRGYIWSRSIPMIKNTLIYGYGADTYSIYFPQSEIDAKLRYLSSYYMTVDKPHNWYIQMAINTGLVSMIAVVLLLFAYGIESMKLYMIENKERQFNLLGTALIAAVFGYSLAGFFNDSIVSVAPYFWALLGMGVGINKYNKE